MANVVGDIAIRVGADIGPLVSDLSKAKGAISSFGAAAQGSASGGMTRFVVAGNLIADVVEKATIGLIDMTKGTFESIDAISKSARMLGIHTTSLQAMAQVANEAGVETGSLTSALSKMQNNIAGLRDGTASQVKAFQDLGLSIGDLNGLGADQQFALIAERINGLQDPTERTAAAMNVFGKSGADLITMFDGYGAAVQDAAKYQRDFGIGVSDLAGQRIEAANDAMGRMKGAAEGLGVALAVSLAPVMDETATAITNLLSALNYANEHVQENAIAIEMGQISDSLAEVETQASLTAGAFSGLADGKIKDALTANVASIEAAKTAFEKGGISAETYKKQVLDAVAGIESMYQLIQDVDGTNMGDAIAQMRAFADAIGIAFGAAANLRGALPHGAVPLPHPGQGTRPVPDTGMELPSGFHDTVFSGIDFGPGGASLTPTQHTGGGGGGSSDASLKSELAAMQKKFMTESQLADQQYADTLARIEKFRKAKLQLEGSYDDLEAAATVDHEKALADIQDRERQARLGAISGAFGDLSTLMQTHNKKLFEIGKAASIASAVIDGYESAVSAWKSGMKVGGPFVAAAFTAASLAKTGALIAGISATHMGGASSAAGGGGGSGVPSVPAATAPGVANITLVGDTFSRANVESLFTQINSGLRQGYQINLV